MGSHARRCPCRDCLALAAALPPEGFVPRHSTEHARHRRNLKPTDPWPWIEAEAAGAHPDYQPTHRAENPT